MNVKELVELLGDLPQDALVVVSSDDAGNSFSLLEDISSNALSSGLSDSPHDMMVLFEGDYEDLPSEDVETLHPTIVIWPN